MKGCSFGAYYNPQVQPKKKVQPVECMLTFKTNETGLFANPIVEHRIWGPLAISGIEAVSSERVKP